MGGHSSGSYPAMPARSGGAADNKVLWIVLGVVAAIALIVIIAVALSGGDESGGGSGGSGGGDDPTGGYTAANEQEFMDTCAPGGGEPMCACAWTEITETIPYDRFVEIENELAELGTDVSPEDLPSDLVTVMTACVGAS